MSVQRDASTAPEATAPPRRHLTTGGFDDLLPYLSGRVFHATTLEHLQAIENTGCVAPNTAHRSSPFWLFAEWLLSQRGCVSLFDYRDCASAAWAEHHDKCLPTLPLREHDAMAILLLKSRPTRSLYRGPLGRNRRPGTPALFPTSRSDIQGRYLCLPSNKSL